MGDTPKAAKKFRKLRVDRGWAGSDADGGPLRASIGKSQNYRPTEIELRREEIQMALDEDVTRLAKGKNLATVVTLMPSGQPQALLTWVDADDEYVLINTEPQRQRARNVSRDPRITVLIHSNEDPWDWAEIRGHVAGTITGDEARKHIDELSHKYTGKDYFNPIGPEGRVILKVAADKINTPRRLFS
jgi:PPOX class probable F420-dependent enzyme